METTWARRLRAAGLSGTGPRSSVLSLLGERPHVLPGPSAAAVVAGAEAMCWWASPEDQGRDRPVAAAAESVQIRQHATRGGVPA